MIKKVADLWLRLYLISVNKRLPGYYLTSLLNRYHYFFYHQFVNVKKLNIKLVCQCIPKDYCFFILIILNNNIVLLFKYSTMIDYWV